MNKVQKVCLALFVLLLALQFLPSNPNTSRGIMQSDLRKALEVPHNVQEVLKTSCYDCHSNNTAYPWYSHIQPIRWMQDRHVREGKENLNFSEFGSYTKRKQRNKLRAIADAVEDGSMPLSSYTMMHKTARLTAENKELIKEWAINSQDSLNKH